MKLFPFLIKSHFSCNSPLPPNEVLIYLKMNTVSSFWSRFWALSSWEGRFYGVFFKTWFYVWLEPTFQNSSVPVFYGKLIPIETGTRIEGFFSFSLGTWITPIIMNIFIFYIDWRFVLVVDGFLLLIAHAFWGYNRERKTKEFLSKIGN